MKQITNRFLLLFISSFAIFFFGCEKEELTNDTAQTDKSELQNNLNLKSFKNKNISENLVVNWEGVHKTINGEFQIEEIEINEKVKTQISTKLFQSEVKYELLSLKKNEKTTSFFIEAYSIKESEIYPSSIGKLQNFTGTLCVYELNGEKIGSIAVGNGIAVNNAEKNDSLNDLILVINSFSTSNTARFPLCTQVVAYNYESWTDWYSSYVDTNGYTVIEFSHSTLNSIEIQYLQVPIPCGTAQEPQHIVNHSSSYISTEAQEISNIHDIMDDGMVNGQPVLVGPNTPITDMADYLDCFNTSLGATITLYADQPKSGSHSLWSSSDGVGHAFISIQQGNNVASLGFYPQSSVGSVIPNSLTPDPTDFHSTLGIFGNDGGHGYDVSISVPVNSSGLTNLINSIVLVAENNPIYNLGSSNCTDVAIMIFESQTSVNIPSCESPSPWSGQTPGTLGQVLSGMPVPTGGTKNINSGSAPNNNCN